jgi:outer membrane protein assembly factor BamB
MLLLLAAAALRADWPTHRGNAARTGCVDGMPGPAKPQVLWVHSGREHFVAAPVIDGDSLYVSGLGPFNTAAFYSLSTDPAAAGPARVRWAKRQPDLKLPTVCAPAIAGGRVILGDGMHQTDGASLHCFAAKGGLRLWRLDVPGRLVHLEGGPTIASGKAYLGGGHAGALCVDLEQVTIDGQPSTLAAAQARLEKEWQTLLAKYEEEKKKDPDFAVPPSEDSLPKVAPKLLWQQGKEKWHVDAPVAAAEGKVFVTSAFLDHEKEGERAIFCLKADTGEALWKVPLKLNPWGGATVLGDTVIVGGSSIRYEPKDLAGAHGDVTAFKTTGSEPLWRKEFPGGVIASVAAANGLAICSATDGKVRGLDLKTGDIKWQYDAGSPLFAGAAVAGDAAYTADLSGVVHAIKLTDGTGLWKLPLAGAPGVGAKQVYGSPVVQGGKIYVATCQLDGSVPTAAVVCIGDK